MAKGQVSKKALRKSVSRLRAVKREVAVAQKRQREITQRIQRERQRVRQQQQRRTRHVRRH